MNVVVSRALEVYTRINEYRFLDMNQLDNRMSLQERMSKKQDSPSRRVAVGLSYETSMQLQAGRVSMTRNALIDLYDHTIGQNWVKKKNWKTLTPLCTWDGVTCDIDGHVTKINLPNNNLVGRHKVHLDFYHVHIYDVLLLGNIPRFFLEHVGVHLSSLNLSGNRLAGEKDIFSLNILRPTFTFLFVISLRHDSRPNR